MASTLGEGCLISENEVNNTGFEDSCALGLPAGVVIVPGKAKWSKADMADPIEWLNTMFHASAATRFFPVFEGISDLAFARESNVTETNNIKGTTKILRTGGYTFTYTWEKGGLCLASKLIGFQGKNYSYIPFDDEGKFALTLNNDGTYSGLESTDVTSDFLPQTPSASPKNILVFTTPFKQFVRAKILNAGGAVVDTLQGLIDTEITKAADATIISVATAATRTITIGTLGADGDSVNVKKTGGTSISGGPVVKTSSETTATLMATKVKNAINTATSTNGGYTATSAGAIITEIAPVSLGATVNAEDLAPTLTGTFAATTTAFAGGVNASGKLKIGVQTECAKTDLVDTYGADIALAALYIVTDTADDSVITPTAVAIVAGDVEITAPIVTGHTYNVVGSAPSVWLTNDVSGYDASSNGVDIVVS